MSTNKNKSMHQDQKDHSHQQQKQQQQTTRLHQGSKKSSQAPVVRNEQEMPETRMFR